ncbi:MAG: hypothetical protein APR62_09320 [Smithella sp. SDB]|nr:MAG: hypothetical protein APR62_09320 [Smithella sp. SDB]
MNEPDIKKYVLTILPEAKELTVSEETILADALIDAGVSLPMPCGGKGVCGRCKVKVEGQLSERTDIEVTVQKDHPGYRLACQTRITGNTCVHIQKRPLATVLSSPSLDLNSDYGMAVDIGTTTVQVALVNLMQHQSYLVDSFLNPQRRYGHDVISRIAAAREPHVFQDLVKIIRNRIFSSVTHFIKSIELSPRRVRHLIFSGNTTMLHLLFGLDVIPIGIYPYNAQRLNFHGFKPEDIDCHDIFPDADVQALPAVSAFLGSDLVGGLTLCNEEGFCRNTFFIDMGTNGEMFLINASDQIAAASCAMGPALEGMNISYGMTADSGAITHMRLCRGVLEYEMIPEGPPVGITGTALIDLLSILLDAGHLTAGGSFHPGIETRILPAPMRYERTAKGKQISLWENMTLTQTDVRNVQLAKGASFAAAKILLREIGCLPEDIERVIIAGAFGQNIDPVNFRFLNFVPDFPSAKYYFLGNTSLKAAERACFDKDFLTKAYMLRDRVQEVDLARHPDFEREFIASLNF